MRVTELFGEVFFLIRKHRMFFIAPILILFAFLGAVFIILGPKAVLSFIYAGL